MYQNKDKHFLLCLVGSIVILLLVIGIRLLCDNMKYEASRDETFTSPSGNYSVVLRYDSVSRPYLFCNNKMVFQYSGSGFNETVFWKIEWLSESEILLYLDSSNGEIVEKYDVMLTESTSLVDNIFTNGSDTKGAYATHGNAI